MSDEDRLRERLRAQGGAVPVVADLDDVAARLARRGRGRERPLIALVAVALVLGTLGGFALGRGGGDSSPSVSVGGAGAPNGDVTTTVEHRIEIRVVPPAEEIGTPTTTIPPGKAGSAPALVLPAPGPEQPADVDVARQGVEQAFDNAMSGRASNQQHADAIVGGQSLLGVFEQLRQGPYGRQVNEAKTVVEGVVFLSATRAAVKYHSDLGADGISGPYLGEATLTDAGWQVTHESYCRVASLAGIPCV